VVPSDADQRYGNVHFVFVRSADAEFQVRRVTCGAHDGDSTEIKEGLNPGELVAVQGSHILKTELLRGQLGDND
jgi:cobalt-zinc-cadmium efflux system membrane fusion protein